MRAEVGQTQVALSDSVSGLLMQCALIQPDRLLRPTLTCDGNRQIVEHRQCMRVERERLTILLLCLRVPSRLQCFGACGSQLFELGLDGLRRADPLKRKAGQKNKERTDLKTQPTPRTETIRSSAHTQMRRMAHHSLATMLSLLLILASSLALRMNDACCRPILSGTVAESEPDGARMPVCSRAGRFRCGCRQSTPNCSEVFFLPDEFKRFTLAQT
jgi:hypothetical protein